MYSIPKLKTVLGHPTNVFMALKTALYVAVSKYVTGVPVGVQKPFD